MSKNVAVFVDVANIFYAAKAAGVDIDYVTLLKSASAGRDLVRAYAYTGLDPENENQRNFHSFLSRHGYRVVSKDIRKYGDGKVKANLDIELVVDMMKTARNLDIAIVVSGDGDFAPAIRAVQEMGVRVEVISFRGNTSSDLIDVADQFTDITALAKVEKGSSRSGRRVAEAGDEEDLSMTEVPDKQTEGTGDRRGRGGRGRGRGRVAEAEPVARTGRSRRATPAAVTSGGTPLVVLPGEKLSRVAGDGTPDGAGVDDVAGEDAEVETGGAIAALNGGLEGEAEGDGEAPRRRRRRGGRGRGRGRGRGEGGESDVVAVGPADDDVPFEAPRAPRTTPFGSVWDSQLGVPTQAPAAASGGLSSIGEDEDFEEPEIPEYLLAERRNRGRTQGAGRAGRGGARGGRSAYTAAIERERYGRGGGGGINRYPDVSARERPMRDQDRDRDRDRDRGRDRGREDRPARTSAAGAGRGEEWSEVPPELEAALRAQLAGSIGRSGSEDRRPARPSTPEIRLDEIETFRLEPESELESEAEAEAPAPVEPSADEAGSATAAAPTARRRSTTRRTTTAATSGDSADGEEVPKRRTTRRKAADVVADASSTNGVGEDAPKRRTTRRTAGTPASETVEASTAASGEEAAPKRRVTRRKTAATAEAAPEA